MFVNTVSLFQMELLIFPLLFLPLSDFEEERVELHPATAGAVWAYHSSCSAQSKNHSYCIEVKVVCIWSFLPESTGVLMWISPEFPVPVNVCLCFSLR